MGPGRMAVMLGLGLLLTVLGALAGRYLGLQGGSGLLTGAAVAPVLGFMAWVLGNMMFERWVHTPYILRSNLWPLTIFLVPLAALAWAVLTFIDGPQSWPARLPGPHGGLLGVLVFCVLLASFAAIVMGIAIQVQMEGHRRTGHELLLGSMGHQPSDAPHHSASAPPERDSTSTPMAGHGPRPSLRRWASLAWLLLCMAFGTWFTAGYPQWGLEGLDAWVKSLVGSMSQLVPALASAVAVAAYALPVMWSRRKIGDAARQRMEIEDAAGETYYLGFLLSLVGIGSALYQFNPNVTTFMADTFGKCGGAIGSTFIALVIRLAALHMLGPDPNADHAG